MVGPFQCALTQTKPLLAASVQLADKPILGAVIPDLLFIRGAKKSFEYGKLCVFRGLFRGDGAAKNDTVWSFRA